MELAKRNIVMVGDHETQNSLKKDDETSSRQEQPNYILFTRQKGINFHLIILRCTTGPQLIKDHEPVIKTKLNKCEGGGK
jgi:hypothetical protein